MSRNANLSVFETEGWEFEPLRARQSIFVFNAALLDNVSFPVNCVIIYVISQRKGKSSNLKSESSGAAAASSGGTARAFRPDDKFSASGAEHHRRRVGVAGIDVGHG
jgi:hypothetical protein